MADVRALAEAFYATDNEEDDDQGAVDVHALFRGVVIDARHIWAPIDTNYIIGSEPDADAPVAPTYVPSSSFALVATSGPDYVINTTPAMAGEVVIDNEAWPLARVVHERGPSFTLPRHGRARIECGEATFLISRTSRARVLGAPRFVWRREHSYNVVSAAGCGVFLLIISLIAPAPKALSFDMLGSDKRFIPMSIIPPQNQNREPGSASAPRGQEVGRTQKAASTPRPRRSTVEEHKNDPNPVVAKSLAQKRAQNAGLLGIFTRTEASEFSSIFQRGSALGSDPEDVLRNLAGTQIGDAYGINGIRLVSSTGTRDSGFGDGTIGDPSLTTISDRIGGRPGSDYGGHASALTRRHTKQVEIVPGPLNVRGSLDKEIIRRIIRRHINEVKYCYEQELAKKADLGGRITVQFVLSSTGAVTSVVLQSSTMGNARVETCVTQAVRRWEFPKPTGGGIAIVSYPFVLTPAGGGVEATRD